MGNTWAKAARRRVEWLLAAFKATRRSVIHSVGICTSLVNRVWLLVKRYRGVTVALTLLTLVAGLVTVAPPILSTYQRWRFPLSEYRARMQSAADTRDWETLERDLDAIEGLDHMRSVYLLFSGYRAIFKRNPKDPERFLFQIPPSDPHFLIAHRLLFMYYVKFYSDSPKFDAKVGRLTQRLEENGVPTPLIYYFRASLLHDDACASAVQLLSELQAEYQHMVEFETYTWRIHGGGSVNLDQASEVIMVALELQYDIARLCKKKRPKTARLAESEARAILASWDYLVLRYAFSSVGQVARLDAVREWAGFPEPSPDQKRKGRARLQVLESTESSK